MMKEETPILSFTSHSRRLPLIDEVFRGHVAMADAAGMRICLALQEDSVPAMTPYQRSLVDSGRIELLTIEKDHGSNTKWTLCRAAHPDAPMIVVDDDRVYPKGLPKELIGLHAGIPSAFLCRALRQLAWTRDGRRCQYHLSRTVPNRAVLYTSRSVDAPLQVVPGGVIVEHWAGCLYPSRFPDPAFMTEAGQNAPHDDDVFMTVLLARHQVSSFLVPSRMNLYDVDMAREHSEIRSSALGRENRAVGWSRTENVIKLYESELRENIRAWEARGTVSR